MTSLMRAACGLVPLLLATAAPAFQGPYTRLVTSYGDGFVLDVDIRWPDDPAPPGGWPVVFFAHGAGGTKANTAGTASTYADDGYVAVNWTARSSGGETIPDVLAGDLLAIKDWVVNDFAAEANVTVPVDPARFGANGFSLGGYTSWSGGLLTNAFATVIPSSWAFHFFAEGMTRNGSIERRTAGPLAATLPTPYDAAGLQSAVDAAFQSAFDGFATCTIPVMSDIAFHDARHGGLYGLHDWQALTASPQRLVYIGTGGHGTPETDGAYRADLRRRWFAHHLKGEDNGIDEEPPIHLALLGTNERLLLDQWPPPGAAAATVWLRAGGALSPSAPTGAETADVFTNNPGSLTWAAAAPAFNPPLLRANFNKSTIAWLSPPLTDELLLLGQPSVRLEVSGTASRYQVNVHLFDQAEGGDPLLLAWGTATVASPSALVDIALGLTGRRVPAGHRLRLEVTNRDDQDVDYTNGYNPSGDVLRFLPFFEASTNSVHHDAARPSSLTLPLVGRDTLPLAGVACDPTPRAGCKQPSVAGASPLTLRNGTTADKDSLSWKWGKGSSTTFGELGDPLGDDHYAFCLYAGTAAPLLEARAPAGGDCDGKPCWKQLGAPSTPKGYRYGDREWTPDGLKTVLLRSRAAPRAKALVKGRGANLGIDLPLPLPVTAQLQSTDTCFEVTYPTAQTNDASTFKAR